MRNAEVFALDHSDLNIFLFSEVGQEPSGLALSVMSLLARLGVDPWGEAARLASLPKDAARHWLAEAIAGVPASPWPLPDANVIAARLVALLPPRGAGLLPAVTRPRRFWRARG